jgi:hypothetical protein
MNDDYMIFEGFPILHDCENEGFWVVSAHQKSKIMYSSINNFFFLICYFILKSFLNHFQNEPRPG